MPWSTAIVMRAAAAVTVALSTLRFTAGSKGYDFAFAGPAKYPLTETSLFTHPQHNLIFAMSMVKTFYAHQLSANMIRFTTPSKFATWINAFMHQTQG